MSRKSRSIAVCAILLLVAAACSKKNSGAADVIVEIPPGFTGNFSLEMGVKGAPPLTKDGSTYVVAVPKNGQLATSTLLTKSQPTFRNSSSGGIWGYSHSVFATGDGIPIGGKIEFFVGTRKEYEAEEGKKNHSGGFSSPPESSGIGI